MAKIKLYGQQTSMYEYVKMMIREHTARVGIALEIQEVNNWEEIINARVMSLPSIIINGKYNISLDECRDVHGFINDVTLKILNEEKCDTMKRILVPTDFSTASTNALIYARSINESLNGLIHLVHVHKPEAIYVENIPVIDEKIEQVKRKRLDDFVASINQSWASAANNVLPIDGLFKVGFVVDELEELCKEKEGECLIIVGSVGSSGQLKKIFGSVSTQIAKKSKGPVIIVPAGATYNRIKDIVFTLADLEIDLKALPQVLDFASIFGAQVHLVHVQNKKAYQGQFLLTIAKESHPHLNIDFESIEGDDVIQSLNDYAAVNSVDMIGMATQSRGFFADLFHRSLTKKMTINTNIPLLIFHETP